MLELSRVTEVLKKDPSPQTGLVSVSMHFVRYVGPVYISFPRAPVVGKVRGSVKVVSTENNNTSINLKDRQINSGAIVRQRTIPTERPPLVGDVSANFSG
jgi:hypothetical protein